MSNLGIVRPSDVLRSVDRSAVGAAQVPSSALDRPTSAPPNFPNGGHCDSNITNFNSGKSQSTTDRYPTPHRSSTTARFQLFSATTHSSFIYRKYTLQHFAKSLQDKMATAGVAAAKPAEPSSSSTPFVSKWASRYRGVSPPCHSKWIQTSRAYRPSNKTTDILPPRPQ